VAAQAQREIEVLQNRPVAIAAERAEGFTGREMSLIAERQAGQPRPRVDQPLAEAQPRAAPRELS
jgi:hypothetical protein